MRACQRLALLQEIPGGTSPNMTESKRTDVCMCRTQDDMEKIEMIDKLLSTILILAFIPIQRTIENIKPYAIQDMCSIQQTSPT